MGELIQLFPKRTDAEMLQRACGELALQEFAPRVNSGELIDRLIDEADGFEISMETFLQVCDDLRISSDQLGAIFFALNKPEIFTIASLCR